MPPTPPKKPERMSSVDTAWLRMDRPTNLMMICGVLIFEERLTLARLKATLGDPSKPLWQFHLVDGYEDGSAVVVRIHHCYADGIALIQVMLSMTDADREGHVPGPVPPPPKRSESSDGEPHVVAGALKMATKIASILVEKGASLCHKPAKAVAFAKQGSAFTEELAKLMLMGQDSPTRFKGQPGVAKRVAWAD